MALKKDKSNNNLKRHKNISLLFHFCQFDSPYPHLKKTKQTLRSVLFIYERVGGIEPPSSAWKADIIATIRHPPAPRLRRAGPLLLWMFLTLIIIYKNKVLSRGRA
ncbi:MAG: hypothetical protein US70_C0005G0034 [Parcubacteria group bacterium GW2011_GWD2_38_11]|nr:MAG: hypothetical protein US70_C0005G0034 [Parcubacteria group bacterium GW2011_GWD2_38_11]